MASNQLPDDRNKLYVMADNMLAGLAMHGASLGVAQNTEAKIRALLEVRDAGGSLILPAVAGTGARNWELAYGNAKATKAGSFTSVHAADAQSSAFIGSAKKHLSNFLGNVWSPAWAPVGYNNATLELTTDENQRFDLLKAYRSFLNLNPNMTVSTPLLTINVSVADSRIAALTAARTLRQNCRTDAATKRDGRDAVEKLLRKRMSGLIAELATLMPGDDPRWAAFGLHAPAGPTLSDKPTGATMQAGPAGFNFLDWNDAARADSYNVLQKLEGETEFTVIANVTDSDATIPEISSGTSAEYGITGLNGAGTGPMSDPLTWNQP